MSPRLAILGLCVALAALPVRADTFSSPRRSFETADHVVVFKSERRLVLYRDGHELKSFHVSLGLSPRGPKQQEGDFRTPEGHYLLTRRNPDSDYYLSIQVSYPDAADIAAARKAGVQPGGAIMIHGLPNVLKHPRRRYLDSDWTDGCIALSDNDMLEVWLRTTPDTPIEILP
jgi:murein L,D-transpeptidase YafK